MPLYTREVQAASVRIPQGTLLRGTTRKSASKGAPVERDTYLDTGRSLPNFWTVASNVCFGSLNFIILRKSTSLLKKNFSTNLRAERSDRCWYTKAVSALGTDASASE